MFVKTGDEMPILTIVDGTVPEEIKQETEDKMKELLDKTENDDYDGDKKN